MKTIKIDFRNFWGGFNKKNNFFFNLLKKEYKIKIDEKNPDYVFFSVFQNKTTGRKDKFLKIIRRIHPKLENALRKSFLWYKIKNSLSFKKKYMDKRMCGIEGDFVKIFYTGENVKPDMSKCDWAFSFCSDEEFQNPKHMRLPYYFFERYGADKLTKSDLDIKKWLEKPKKFCNFLYGNEVIYRNKFFDMLSEYKKIDSPGKCRNNMPFINIPFEQENWKELKDDFLGNYKFTIAFESFIQDYYTTEKIAQPMSAGSIPIYYGNPKVGLEFNEKSFINVHKFKSFDEAIKEVIRIDNDPMLYEQMLREPWFKDNNPNKFVDEERILQQLRRIFN